MFKIHPLPCFYEIGKPGNWRSCCKQAQWSIVCNSGSSISYCTRHKQILEKKLGTPKILEHIKPAPFAKFRKLT